MVTVVGRMKRREILEGEIEGIINAIPVPSSSPTTGLATDEDEWGYPTDCCVGKYPKLDGRK